MTGSRNPIPKSLRKYSTAFVDIILVTAGLLAERGFSFLTAIVVARAIGVEEFGEFTLFTTIFVLASEIPNGINTTFIRYANHSETREGVAQYLGISLLLKLCYAFLLSLIGWVFSAQIAEFLFHKPETVNLVRLAIISGGFYSIFGTLVGVYQQSRNFLVVSYLRPIFNILVFLMVLLLAAWYVKLSPIGVGWGYLFIAVFLSVVAMLTIYFKSEMKFTGMYAQVRNFIKHAAVLIGSSIINLTSGRLDVIFIASMLSMSDLGNYGAALRVAMVLSLFNGTFTTILLPRAPGAQVARDNMRKYLLGSFAYLAGFILLAIVVGLYVEEILGLAFGEEYKDAGLIALILIGRVGISCAGVPFQLLLQCSGRPSLFFSLTIVRMLLDILLLSTLIPAMGAAGAAMATSLSAAAMTIAMAILVYLYVLER